MIQNIIESFMKKSENKLISLGHFKEFTAFSRVGGISNDIDLP